MFEFIDDADSQIGFSVASNNPNLVVTRIDANGMLSLDLASNPTGAATITVQAVDSLGTTVTTFTVGTTTSTARMSNLVVNPSGLTLDFTAPIDTSTLNLFDGVDAAIDASDFMLVGTNTGPVRGSLVFNAAGTTATFIKSGGPLAPDNYALTLHSRLDGWKDTAGNLLDGDEDSVAGGNLAKSIMVTASTARVVSVADFARGALQRLAKSSMCLITMAWGEFRFRSAMQPVC